MESMASKACRFQSGSLAKTEWENIEPKIEKRIKRRMGQGVTDLAACCQDLLAGIA
jgi:hypothetical protein